MLTHLAISRLGGEESLYSCNDHYSKLKMESNNTISSYYQKLQSAVSAKNEAFLRCSPGVELQDVCSRWIYVHKDWFHFGSLITIIIISIITSPSTPMTSSAISDKHVMSGEVALRFNIVKVVN